MQDHDGERRGQERHGSRGRRRSVVPPSRQASSCPIRCPCRCHGGCSPRAEPPPTTRPVPLRTGRTPSRRCTRTGARRTRPRTPRAARTPTRPWPRGRRRRRRTARRIRDSHTVWGLPCRPSPRGRTPDPGGRATSSTRAANASPARPATPNETSAASLTSRTVARPPATRRTGPTRCSSVPRTPSA